MALPYQIPSNLNDTTGWDSAVSGMTPEQRQRLWLALHVDDGQYTEPPPFPAMQRAADATDAQRPGSAPSTFTLTAEAGARRRAANRKARQRPEVQLSAGSESRLDGAPNSQLPAYEEAVDAVSIRMLEEAGLPLTPEYKAQVRQQAEERVNAEIQRSRLPDSPPAAPAPPPEVRSYVPDMPAGPRGGVTPTPEWSDAKIEELTNAILSQPDFGSGPDARARARSMAENEVRNLRMTRWQSQRQSAGNPHRDFASEFGGSVPDYEMSVPAPISNDPAKLRGDDLEAYQRMVGEGEVSSGEPLTPEQVAEVRRRSAVRWDVRTDNERYGPYWMGDQEIADLAEANRPYTAPSAGEVMKGAAGLVRPSLPVGWSPEGATVPPPLTGAGPTLPAGPSAIDQATSGLSPGGKPMRVDDPDTAPLPSLWNQMDSRGVQSGANVPLPGQTDPRYEFWKGQRQARTAGRDRFWDSPAQREAKIQRMALRAGISYEEAAALADAGREGLDRQADGPLTAAERAEEFKALRAKVRGKQVSDAMDRQRRRSEMAALAGGQPTGGIGGTRAAYAQEMFQRDRIDALLGRLSQEGVSDWERAGIMAQLAPNANTANPTPLGVDAVGAQNAMRMMNAEALAGMDPFRQEMARERQRQMELSLPPDQRAGLSISRGEPMGSGLSAGPVQEAWNSAVGAMFGGGEAAFRRKMESWGYSPEQIDAWIDSRMDAEPQPEPGAPAPVQTPSGPRPGGTPYSRM